MRSMLPLAASAALLYAASCAAADDFESAPDEPASASLSAAQVAGNDFHVHEPVTSDGLMHHYVLESRFGTFSAYGQSELAVRLGEVAALATIARTSAADVVFRSVTRGLQEDVRSATRIATDPAGVVTGIPRGIGHLLSGYRAQAREISQQAGQALHGSGEAAGTGTASGTAGRVASQTEHYAKSYADRYLGLSAAERRWYASLHADPYTDNEVLRGAVKRLARIDTAASFGMRFAPIGIPFAGEVNRALEVIYNEDPAVLRQRRHEELLAAGLTAAEVTGFENAPLLNPTRQTMLVEAVRALAGVSDRAELLRHAAAVTTEVETEVFLASTMQLVRFHTRQPVARIVTRVRVPSAQLPDGRIVVFGAFDAVYWTEQVAAYERDLRAALPSNATGHDLWLTGSVSPRARTELQRLGWGVHDRSEAPAPGQALSASAGPRETPHSPADCRPRA